MFCCNEAWNDIEAFYQADCINYRGRTSDTNRYYSEIVAEYVLNHMEEFRAGIPTITRESCYDLHHNGVYRRGTGRKDFNLLPNIKVMASPFVFYKREQWSEWVEKRPMLMKLMSELESIPYFINEQDGKFIIREN